MAHIRSWKTGNVRMHARVCVYARMIYKYVRTHILHVYII